MFYLKINLYVKYCERYYYRGINYFLTKYNCRDGKRFFKKKVCLEDKKI